MRTLFEKVDIARYEQPDFDFYFGDKRIGIFDIETTGLSPQSSRLILSGFVCFEDDGAAVKQFFAESLSDEDEVLEKTFEELDKLDVVITFNGKHFDFPFIFERARRLRGFLAQPERRYYNLDIYRLLNKYSDLRRYLPNLKQKTCERFLGLGDDRKDEISGAESVALYFEFLSSRGDAKDKLRDFILLHNRDDVCQLARLLPLLERFDLHYALSGYGFPAGRISLDSVRQKGTRLKIEGRYSYDIAEDYFSYPVEGSDYLLRVDSLEKSFALDFPLRVEKGYAFIDLKRVFSGETGLLEKLCSMPGVYKGFLPAGRIKACDYKALNSFAAEASEGILKALIEK